MAMLAFAALCLLGFYGTTLYQAYSPFRQKAAILARDTFVQGIYVDGVHIGGMTRAEAENALKASGKFIPWQVVTISCDGKILD